MRDVADAGRVLGALEERLMDLLWAHGAMTVREACGRRAFAGLAYTTVMTTLDRLHKKGFLTRQKEGHAFLYRPALTRAELDCLVVEQAVADLISRSPQPVLAALVDVAASIDAENLARLERLVAARKRKTK